jgi:hypothetical protein
MAGGLSSLQDGAELAQNTPGKPERRVYQGCFVAGVLRDVYRRIVVDEV